MSKITIYHNPRCSKSRSSCQLLDQAASKYEIVEYLKTPPSPAELAELSRKLGLEPTEFIRSKEKTFKELGLSLKDDRSRDEWFALMSENPVLIERPIVVKGDKAVLGRPPENINELL